MHWCTFMRIWCESLNASKKVLRHALAYLTVALLFESMSELFSVSLLTSSLLQRYESHKNSKRNMYVFVMINIADRRVLWRHFRSTSGFIGCWKIFSQKFLLHQKIRRKISGGVLGSIFHLWPHLVGVITDFHPYVSLLTNKSATVKLSKDRPTRQIIGRKL